jgi:hypothetical protein
LREKFKLLSFFSNWQLHMQTFCKAHQKWRVCNFLALAIFLDFEENHIYTSNWYFTCTCVTKMKHYCVALALSMSRGFSIICLWKTTMMMHWMEFFYRKRLNARVQFQRDVMPWNGW